jgi:hypothetical protein
MQIGRSAVSASRKSSAVAVSQTPHASSRSIDMATLPIGIVGFAPQTSLTDFRTDTGFAMVADEHTVTSASGSNLTNLRY